MERSVSSAPPQRDGFKGSDGPRLRGNDELVTSDELVTAVTVTGEAGMRWGGCKSAPPQTLGVLWLCSTLWDKGSPSQPGASTHGEHPKSSNEDEEAEAALGERGVSALTPSLPGAAFSCKAGEFLDMRAQACRPCAEGTYSLGTGVRFDEWDEVPHGFANVATSLEVDDGFGDAVENCTA